MSDRLNNNTLFSCTRLNDLEGVKQLVKTADWNDVISCLEIAAKHSFDDVVRFLAYSSDSKQLNWALANIMDEGLEDAMTLLLPHCDLSDSSADEVMNSLGNMIASDNDKMTEDIIPYLMEEQLIEGLRYSIHRQNETIFHLFTPHIPEIALKDPYLLVVAAHHNNQFVFDWLWKTYYLWDDCVLPNAPQIAFKAIENNNTPILEKCLPFILSLEDQNRVLKRTFEYRHIQGAQCVLKAFPNLQHNDFLSYAIRFNRIEFVELIAPYCSVRDTGEPLRSAVQLGRQEMYPILFEECNWKHAVELIELHNLDTDDCFNQLLQQKYDEEYRLTLQNNLLDIEQTKHISARRKI